MCGRLYVVNLTSFCESFNSESCKLAPYCSPFISHRYLTPSPLSYLHAVLFGFLFSVILLEYVYSEELLLSCRFCLRSKMVLQEFRSCEVTVVEILSITIQYNICTIDFFYKRK